MRTMASVGCWMVGSGTSSTRTSRRPCQVSALMSARPTHSKADKSGRSGQCVGLLPVVTLGDGRRAWLSRPMRRMSRALPTAWAVAGSVGALASVLVPSGPWRSVTVLTVAVGAAAVVVLGTRLHRPPAPRPWLLLAGALAVFAAAEAVTELVDRAWAVDALRLAGYPLLVAALVAVWRARRSAPGWAGWAGWVDAAVVAVTAALGYWVFVVDLEGLDTTATARPAGLPRRRRGRGRPGHPAGRGRRVEHRVRAAGLGRRGPGRHRHRGAAADRPHRRAGLRPGARGLAGRVGAAGQRLRCTRR